MPASAGASGQISGPVLRSGQEATVPGCMFCCRRPSSSMQDHFRTAHSDLCYLCQLCGPTSPRLATLYGAEEHLRQIHSQHFKDWPNTRLVQQLVMPGTEFFQQNGEVNFGAWAAVKCKGKCTFNGIGLRESARDHLESSHPGEGIENLNIFCRICEQNINKSVHNFEDEEELKEHVMKYHKELVELVKKSSVRS